MPDDDLAQGESVQDVGTSLEPAVLHAPGVIVENRAGGLQHPKHFVDALALPGDVLLMREVVGVAVITGPRTGSVASAVPEVIGRRRDYEVDALVRELCEHLQTIALVD